LYEDPTILFADWYLEKQKPIIAELEDAQVIIKTNKKCDFLRKTITMKIEVIDNNTTYDA